MSRFQAKRLANAVTIILGVALAAEGTRRVFMAWESSLITIGVTALASILVIYSWIRTYEQLELKTSQEIFERKRLEAKLNQLNQELEERVKEQTFDLTQLTVELELEMAKHKQAKAIAQINLERAVEERTRELSTMLEISKNVTSTLELEHLLLVILEQIKSVIPYSGAAIFALENEHLEALAYQVPDLKKQVSPLHLTLTNAGPYQEVIRRKSVLIIDDLKEDTPLANAIREAAGSAQQTASPYARAWIGIPLIVKEQVIGLLSLTHKEPNYYNQRHVQVAQTIANQLAIAMENARLYEHAQDCAALEERQRIARELHDSVSQLLYGICLYSTAAGKAMQSKNFDLAGQNNKEIKENALQALQEMRLLIFELHPPSLQDEGLVSALQTCLQTLETRTGLQAELLTEGMSKLPGPIEGELFRIAMETLTNMTKHARAKKVTVDLRPSDGFICMEIRDNGVGFNLEEARNGGGFGLRIMEERVKQINGSLEIDSIPGAGTRVKIMVPVAAEENHPLMLAM
jgi:signal transduction histidine kinase